MIVAPSPGLDPSRRRTFRLRGAGPGPEEQTLCLLAMRAVELARADASAVRRHRSRRPGFGRAVDEIRAQLAPIELRATLVASFGQEAARRSAVRGASADPLDLAYAVRWLELDPTGLRPIPAWIDWLPVEPG